MSLETALYDHWQNTAAVTAIFSDRMNIGVVSSKSGDNDAVAFLVISDIPAHAQSGASGVTEATVQVDVYSTTHAGCRAGTEAIRASMDGRHQAALGAEDLDVRSITLEDTRITYEPPPQNKEQGKFRGMMTFTIWYAQSVPSF